ncbi:hypothetical protein P5G65_08345 [Paenibacillus chondroitinus]|uniref:Uncharacterized protein n=1 Tax=Paenibacillus chondroitinus TaxID=59842 RepID=A0ABU6D824_9BACL|nr:MULTISPECIES: hypothetical protein [Paenibacillus]MEB4793901.1 hypothetical protein [Paenibacillus chondroitinus]
MAANGPRGLYLLFLEHVQHLMDSGAVIGAENAENSGKIHT